MSSLDFLIEFYTACSLRVISASVVPKPVLNVHSMGNRCYNTPHSVIVFDPSVMFSALQEMSL